MQQTTSSAYPAALVRALRVEIASVISDFSANKVPDLCTRLGLREGDRDEFFKSKFVYAERRLLEKSASDLIPIAARLLEEVDSYSLSEAKSKLEEHGKPSISELTRKRVLAIFDTRMLTTEHDHMDFLRRIWPLSEMPSIFSQTYDGRTLDDDLIQATVRNSDWTDREILERVGLLTCSLRQFFRFLEAITSPLVQTAEAQADLTSAINDLLRHDGFRLTIVRRMSGSPVYEVQAAAIGSPADLAISQALAAYDADTIHARWTQALDRRDTNPEGAITLARTLLEDVCKWIVVEAGEAYEEKDDLPALYKKLAKILKLAPDDHTETVFKQILGSCQSVVESLGSLRNKISDAHSLGPRRVRPAPRHAQLAVNLSGTMATFLVDTWNARKAEKAAQTE